MNRYKIISYKGLKYNSSLKTDKKALTEFFLNLNKNLVDSKYCYHVTTFKNIPSMISNGLDSNFGGKGGLGEQIGHKEFSEKSKGYIHGTSNTACVGTYIDIYEFGVTDYELVKMFNIKFKTPSKFSDMALVLRFPKDIKGIDWRIDPDDRRAIKSKAVIKPENLQALTIEGWVNIRTLVEVQKII